MRRALFAGVCFAFLALAGPAYGTTRDYSGTSNGHVVEFSTKAKDGDNVKVVELAYSGFSMACDTGIVPFSGSPFEAKVNGKGRFEVKPYDGDRLVIAGKFSKSELTATGTFITDGHGTFPGVGHCEGEQAWAVERIF